MSSLASKIAIGTAQFGLIRYGIHNSRDSIPDSEISEILKEAHRAGIRTIDTASGYGNAEARLGHFLPVEESFAIVSKLPGNVENIEQLRNVVSNSLNLLKQRKIYGYLFHDFATYDKYPALWDELQNYKNQGVIQKIGFSLYHPRDLETLLQRKVSLDIVQIPFNVFDRRFAPYLIDLRQQGVEVHIRSLFLQGLFFVPEDKLSPHFNSVRPQLSALREIAKKNALPLSALLLHFALQNPDIGRVIIGVDGIHNLRDNLAALADAGSAREAAAELEDVNVVDESILLPYLWK